MVIRVAPRISDWRAVVKRWAILGAVVGTPLLLAWWFMIRMPGASHSGPLPPADDAVRALAAELESDVRKLAVEIGERNSRTKPKLDEAARHMETSLVACGRTRRVEYRIDQQWYANIEGEIAGGARSREIVVVGGHYDSVPDCPGANDNATGAAAVLALARRFAGTKPARTLRFVGFVNEEPPWFQTDDMGSLVYARACREAGDEVAAMLSLETLGCYSDEPGSQKYPAPGLSLAYPSQGDFVSFVSDSGASDLVRQVVAEFRLAAKFPSEGAALPSGIQGVDWSDHWSFRQQGWPAVMVTDTAPFRSEHYHRPTDSVEHVDFERLARVVQGLAAVVERLANPDR